MSDSNVVQINLSKAIEESYDTFVDRMNGIKVPPIVFWGKPGIGKTQNLTQYYQSKDVVVVSILLSMTDSSDINGLPKYATIKINDHEIETTNWTMPDIVAQVVKASLKNPGKNVLLFLDDIHLCSRGHMAALMEIFTEYKLNNHKIPKNVGIMLAGNDSALAGATNSFFSAVHNRMDQYWVYPDYKDFEDYANKSGFNRSVMAFFNDNRYRDLYFTENETNKGPFCSPRTIEYFSHKLNRYEKNFSKQYVSENVLRWASGLIGSKAAADFTVFYNHLQLVNAPDIFNGKNKLDVPIEFSDQYIYTVAITHEFYNQYKKNKNAMKILIELYHELMNKNNPTFILSSFRDLFAFDKVEGPKITTDIIKEMKKPENKILHDEFNTYFRELVKAFIPS